MDKGSSGKTGWRHRIRCRKSKCGKRATLKKFVNLENVVCGVCGGPVRSDEKNRRNEMAKADTCYCSGLPFPHKKATILGCINHPLDPEDWTKEQNRRYQTTMETKRSI